MRAEYSGDVIEFRTANGRRLCVTPNHIVLSSRGWIRAKNLVKGDKVVYYAGDVIDSSVIKPADNHGAPTIKDLFTAIVEASSCPASSMPSTSVALKGDVVPNSKIDIVYVDSELRNKLDASFRKLICDHRLVLTCEAGKGPLAASSTLATFFVGIGLAADGIMSSADITSVLLAGALGHHELISFRTSSDYYARLFKSTYNSGATDIEPFSQSIDAFARFVEANDSGIISFDSNTAELNTMLLKDSLNRAFVDPEEFCNIASSFPGLIALDDVVLVTKKFYSGHVYDTSCMSTLYICNGIITSNCRCSTAASGDREAFDRQMDSGIVSVRMPLKGDGVKNNTSDQALLFRAKSTHNEKELRLISNSKVIDFEDHDEIIRHFQMVHHIQVEGFTEEDLFRTKAVLAGCDDFLNTFKGCRLKKIKYDPSEKNPGVYNRLTGVISIGSKGLGSYGTGVHECAHSFDVARSLPGENNFAEGIVASAIKNLKLRRNSKQFTNLAFQIVQDSDIINSDPKEFYAYSVETAMGGVANSLAMEILRLTMEEVN